MILIFKVWSKQFGIKKHANLMAIPTEQGTLLRKLGVPAKLINEITFQVFLIRKITLFITIMTTINSNNMIPKTEPKICKTYIVGGNGGYKGKTIAMTIPMEFRKLYNLEKPTNVLVTPTEQGLLVKKLEIKQ